MSKRIKLTQEIREECFESFKQALDLAKMSDGKISFTKSFDCKDDRKAVLYFTEKAWLKMTMLVQDFSSEVAWHGLAYRGEDENEDAYYITDILVYPQEVTGSTVNTDQMRYETWMLSHDDDVFNNIRMQGHSHVNMTTGPSPTDLSHQGKILDQLEDDMFYIFIIWNKRNERNIKIYDMKKNTLFENTDITIAMLDGDLGLMKFLAESRREVIQKVYNYGKPAQGTGGGTTPNTQKSATTPATTPTSNAPANTPATTQQVPALPAGKEKVRPAQYGAGWHGANASSAFEGDCDDDVYDYYRRIHGFE